MAATLNITARQGSVFNRTITYTDAANVAIDLTGYGVRMQVRKSFADYDATKLLDLTIGSGISWSNQSGGVFIISVDATTMASVPNGKWQYDLELVPAGDDLQAFAIIAGQFIVKPEVTR